MQQRAWMLVAAVVGIAIVAACNDKEVTGPSNITYTATLNSNNELPTSTGAKPATGATGTWTGVLIRRKWWMG